MNSGSAPTSRRPILGPSSPARFVFVSGRPGLDFAGTLKWRRSAAPEEQLATPADLSRWALEARLVTSPPAVGDPELVAARELREAIYQVLDAELDRRALPRRAVRTVNARAQHQPLRPRLLGSGRVQIPGDAEGLLAALAVDVIELLGSPDRGRISRCANPDCTRVFVDSSRLGNRVWCGMAECGNRAKVRAFRQRRAVL